MKTYHLSDVDMGEEEAQAVAEVVRSKWLSAGPRTAEFEQAFAEAMGARHAVALSSCTAALHLALAALDVGPGDEVLLPSYTFVATANAVLYQGATPVFVDICGPGNLVTFAKTVPESWRRFMRDGVGDPEAEEQELLRRSPVTYLDDLRCPLLVIQGAHDPRVHKSESDEIVARIRQRGGTVDYLVFEDEGHHFLKKSNQRRMARTVADFLLRHTGKERLCE